MRVLHSISAQFMQLHFELDQYGSDFRALHIYQHTTASLQHIPVLVPSLGHLLGDGALAAPEFSEPVENMKATRYHRCLQAVHKQSEMIILEYILVVMPSLSPVLCRMEDSCSASNGISEQAMRVTV